MKIYSREVRCLSTIAWIVLIQKFISHWGLSSAKVTFNMEDFFYWSTVKRERGLYYPYSRQFTFALNVAF